MSAATSPPAFAASLVRQADLQAQKSQSVMIALREKANMVIFFEAYMIAYEINNVVGFSKGNLFPEVSTAFSQHFPLHVLATMFSISAATRAIAIFRSILFRMYAALLAIIVFGLMAVIMYPVNSMSGFNYILIIAFNVVAFAWLLSPYKQGLR